MLSNHFCALSVFEASAASVAPFSFATLLSITPVDLYATRYGTAGFGCLVVITTVESPTALTLLKLAAMKAGAAFTFLTRCRLKTTSAAVSGSPLLNFTP